MSESIPFSSNISIPLDSNISIPLDSNNISSNMLEKNREYIFYCTKIINDFKKNIAIKLKHIKLILLRSYEIICYDINEFDISKEKKDIIIDEITKFYKDAKKQINSNIIYNNLIGTINIFLFQCIILFTKHNIDSLFIDNQNDIYPFYYDLITNKPWKTHIELKKILLNSDKNEYFFIRKNFSNLYTQENFICLIIIGKYLETQTIVEQFLDNIIYCGFSYKLIKVDGFIYTPFEFLYHDIIHAKNYHWSCRNSSTDLNKVKEFYYNCKNEIHLSENNSNERELFKKNFKKIILIIFLLLHESFCNFFPNNINDGSIIEKIKLYFNNKIYRFTNIDDLMMNIPKEFRNSQDNIIKYLFECTNFYFNKLHFYEYVSYYIRFNVVNNNLHIHKNISISKEIRKNLIDTILIHLKEMYELINPNIFKELNSYNKFINWIDIYLMYPSKFRYDEIITSYPYISMNKIKKYIIKYIGNRINNRINNRNIFILPSNITNIDENNINKSYEIKLKNLESSKISYKEVSSSDASQI